MDLARNIYCPRCNRPIWLHDPAADPNNFPEDFLVEWPGKPAGRLYTLCSVCTADTLDNPI